jgi:hypothetical protein
MSIHMTPVRPWQPDHKAADVMHFDLLSEQASVFRKILHQVSSTTGDNPSSILNLFVGLRMSP